MIDLGLQANLSQTLELLLSPRLLQMLKVLQLPYMELIDKLASEAEENVMLEVERRDIFAEYLNFLTSDKKIKKEADFSELPGLENIGRVAQTLEDHLLEQLELYDIEEKHREIGQDLIGNIDDHGYLLAYPKLREEIMKKHDVSRPTVDKVLKIIQGFEPEGVGARDLQECLLIQIEAFDFESEALYQLLKKTVETELPKVEAKDIDGLAAALGIGRAGAEEVIGFFKNNLNPYPGLSFGAEAKHIIPSFALEKEKMGGYRIINLEERYGPILKLSPEYLKMLENPKIDKETVAFLKEKLRRAKELMEDFSKRSETLGKIVRKIIDSQPDFLAKGALYLKPLTQKSLAEEFGLHPSTISRAVAEKYIQTPHGLFPLRFLCPRGFKELSPARIKALIAEIIKGEDKAEPLNDEQVTKILNKQGLDIDRRTVAFYRKAIKLPAADGRRNASA